MSKYGHKHSEESKRKISQAKMGHIVSEETKKKISEAKMGSAGFWLGKKFSEETKKRISEGKKGTKLSEETKEKLRIASTGRRHSEESKKKMSIWQKGKSFTEYHKKHLSEALKGNTIWIGKHHSEESKRKMSDARIGRFTGEENINWLGGKSFELYTKEWTQLLKKRIRERDSYTCQICSKQQGDKAFDVHHIDYNKKNCNPDNLITLCKSCHSKTNHNRNYWETFFIIREAI